MKKQEMPSPEIVKDIVSLARKGDKQDLSQLVDIYSSRLYGYFYRLTGNRDEANELLSELFLKMVEKIGSCRPETFEAWLFRIASNLFTDYLRTKKRNQKMLSHIEEQVLTEAQMPKKDNFLTDKLARQLQKLEPETAEIIVMRYYSQLSFEELAQMRKEPIGTVLSKVHRGLKKLRQLMEDSDD
ncbi:MAG: sigma-70 family RNA polymerase sigma factor [Planctomycetes bacterium]|nr:sigma-70 family RNA polymerase sigma factor [Planctomycetota bacterium]MBU1518646.1 sigma-70 family RNA polymerase sigma factor [Planctomycetota bacterium]MBU2458134.1 sigma-70 family RNA polymerase sigma factor [Planctomycetota bacterium]MBU2597181.1 sigma-70 family RNA polymerase sigma factor [Planctomycetota bacterium]